MTGSKLQVAEALKHLLLASGTSWVLWLLGGLSVASIATVIERWLFYRSRDADLGALAAVIDQRLAAGETAQAIAELGRSRSVAACIAATGLRLAHLGPTAVDKAMQSASALERVRLEARLAFLGTLGNNAPFVGLFGTVIGVIHAFEELGRGSGSTLASAAAGQVASQAVMTAIAEALVATAVGILVALPAVAAHNYFQRLVSALLAGSEVLSNLVLAYLSGNDGGFPGGGGEPRLPSVDGERTNPAVGRDPLPEVGR